MMSVKEIREWLDAIPDDERIGIDDDGCLAMDSDREITCEVGYLPAKGQPV